MAIKLRKASIRACVRARIMTHIAALPSPPSVCLAGRAITVCRPRSADATAAAAAAVAAKGGRARACLFVFKCAAMDRV